MMCSGVFTRFLGRQRERHYEGCDSRLAKRRRHLVVKGVGDAAQEAAPLAVAWGSAT